MAQRSVLTVNFCSGITDRVAGIECKIVSCGLPLFLVWILGDLP